MGNVTQLVKLRMENKKETCLAEGLVRDDPYLFINKHPQVGLFAF